MRDKLVVFCMISMALVLFLCGCSNGKQRRPARLRFEVVKVDMSEQPLFQLMHEVWFWRGKVPDDLSPLEAFYAFSAPNANTGSPKGMRPSCVAGVVAGEVYSTDEFSVVGFREWRTRATLRVRHIRRHSMDGAGDPGPARAYFLLFTDGLKSSTNRVAIVFEHLADVRPGVVAPAQASVQDIEFDLTNSRDHRR